MSHTQHNIQSFFFLYLQNGCLDFLKSVYTKFGFTFKCVLSTRPEKFLGEIEVWDNAEKALSESLDAFGQEWKLNPGDGAL